jgi:proteasome lid subunit RPN8/RPN11
MLAYAQASKGEISGFCKNKVTKSGKNIKVEVLDIKIFVQEVNDSFTRLTTDELTAHYLDLIKRQEKPTDWNLWWHSHSDGQVFFSAIDVPTIEQVGKNAPLFSICINTYGDLTARYDKKGKLITEADVIIDYPVDEKIKFTCKKEVEEKVTYKSHIYDEKTSFADYVYPTRGYNTSDSINT